MRIAVREIPIRRAIKSISCESLTSAGIDGSEFGTSNRFNGMTQGWI